MISFAKNIKRTLRDLDENYKVNRNTSNIWNELRDLILLHSKVKQLSIT